MNSVLNMVIPGDIKVLAIQGFLEIVEGLDNATIQAFVDNDVSLWKQIIPESHKPVLIEGSKQYMVYAKMANPDLILGWISEARPDLAAAVSNEKGAYWFWKQWHELEEVFDV